MPNNNGKSQSSYRQILHSSSIIAGSQVVTMLLGLVRMKLAALIIGPAGMGVFAILQSITQVSTTIGGLGVQGSGVKEVAKYHAQGDQSQVEKLWTAMTRLGLVAGAITALLLILTASWTTVLSFGDDYYYWSVVALSLAPLISNLIASQNATIQGMREIPVLAKVSIYGSILGSLTSTLILFLFKTNGIAGALLSINLCTLLVSTLFIRRLSVRPRTISWRETFQFTKILVALGSAIVFSSLLVAAVAYTTRLLIQSSYGLEGVGIYSAAFMLSGLFVQFVLQAMGSDFYPRLVSVAHDQQEMCQLIDRQTEIGILLSFPGLIGTLVFAPTLINLFFTPEFAPASGILKWLVLGCFGRAISWPLGFAILAKGWSKAFVLTETASNAIQLGLTWLLLKQIGLNGVGIAFAATYAIYSIGLLLFMRMAIGFSWSRRNVLNVAWMTTFVSALAAIPPKSIHGFEFVLYLALCLLASAPCIIQIRQRLLSPIQG
jgi:PST family polysaccharide transporter